MRAGNCAILVLLLVALDAARGSQDTARHPAQEDSPKIPQVVKRYLEESRSRAVQEDLPELRLAFGADFELNFSTFFCKETLDFRDQKSRAWLVGYTLGDSPPQSISPIYRAALVSDKGDLMMSLGEETAGEEAIVFGLGDGRQAAAIFRDGGRPHIGKITVVTLERQPRTLFVYQPPFEGPYWDSTLYFVQGKGPEVIVKREVLDFKRGRKWTEGRLLRLDRNTQQYIQVQELSAQECDVLVNARKSRLGVPKIELLPPPYDEAAMAKLKTTQAPTN